MELTAPAAALTDAVLDLFRVTNLLMAEGDRLVAGTGLTSARWQVLGAIAYAGRPQPVAWLARDLGGNRQNIQRLVNDLCAEGLVEMAPNPHHRRARLVVLTEAGGAAYAQAMRLWAPRANGLVADHPVEDIRVMAAVLKSLRRRLEEIRAGEDA